MQTVAIHHSADFDGLFCREIARKALPNAKLIGWDYGDPVPEIAPTDRLYMLDISVAELMNHPHLTWIDHHKTAIDKFGEKRGIQIDGVAACRLAWQWCFGDCNSLVKPHAKRMFIDRRFDEPLAVRLAGEYDVWDKRDPRADLFQHGLRSRELTPAVWSELLFQYNSSIVNDLLIAGEGIQFYQETQNASIIAKSGFDAQFYGLEFLALNTPRCNSLAFTAGLEPRHDAVMGFWWDGNKRKWKVSLYGVPGKPDVDLTPIALQYGGGGHKQACGFETDAPEFLTAIGFDLTQSWFKHE